MIVDLLVVGHTHEDINAFFNYFSKYLKKINICVFVDLVKGFMDSPKQMHSFRSLCKKLLTSILILKISIIIVIISYR